MYLTAECTHCQLLTASSKGTTGIYENIAITLYPSHGRLVRFKAQGT